MAKAKKKKKIVTKRRTATRKKQFLGDFVISSYRFKNLDKVFKELLTGQFEHLAEMQKSERLNQLLLNLILTAPMPNFLLGAVIEYIDFVNKAEILSHYSFSSFEFWLNQYSGLSEEKNYEVRARITGKYIPREEYQIYFPIGMGKKFGGSHFVTAHGSPDLDTTIASFWGWVDAFAARVSEGLHIWNVPGGAAPSQVEVDLLFYQVFGQNLLPHLAKGRTSLTVSSLDLMTQKGVVKKGAHESSISSSPDRAAHAVILTDERGYYLGDWRGIDVEGVRQVLMLLNQTLRWFENHLHVQLISFFGKQNLSKKDLPPLFRSIFDLQIEKTPPVVEMTEKQKESLENCLIRVLRIEKGLSSTFEEFAHAMKQLSLYEFQEFIYLVESMQNAKIFDRSGFVIENRPLIFNLLEKLILGLDNAIQSVRTYVEKMGVALKIKTEVFGHHPQVLSYRADIEEIRSKMGSYPYLTVTSTDNEGRHIPLGVIHSNELLKPILGTVTLRDFCNREETKIPSYLEVISVIDHHKSFIQTSSPPVVLIADAQSSNALVAMLAFKVNDHFSTGNMSAKEIKEQIAHVKKDLSTPKNKRIFQRLLQKQMVQDQKNSFFISPDREVTEYLHFLYAILDDTDLLTKVSLRDLECVASLLNRIKSLVSKQEVEILSFDDLPRDDQFVKKAVKRILQNRDTYSLYRKIYLAKEEAVEDNLKLCIKGLPSTIFADTKEQNGCCRVGQTKLFKRNIPSYEKQAQHLREIWLEEAQVVFKEKREVDLHLHMISTVSGADDLFCGSTDQYAHQDELWMWIPSTEQAIEHLKIFLNAFAATPQALKNKMEVEFLGENAEELERIFNESFLPIRKSRAKKSTLPIAILRFTAGSINSRKAHISPCLPHLIS